MDRLLIAGAGVTGALCSSFLTNSETRPTSVTIWDKGRGAGGRMSTSRAPGGGSGGALPAPSADLGAQYFTAMENHWNPESIDVHKSVYAELLHCGVLRPINGSIAGDNYDYSKQQLKSSDYAKDQPKNNDELKHYVATTGSSSIVKHFLKKTVDTDVQFNQTIESISLTEDKKSWRVSTKEGVSGEFDGVVLTMPVPQILQLKGDIRQKIDSRDSGNVKKKLEGVSYSSRYALAAWYGPNLTLAEDVDWSAKYFYDDPCLRYIAIDPKKRGVQSEVDGTVIVVHTSVPFGLKHLEMDVEEVKQMIMKSLNERLPELKGVDPINIKCQRWRYSQVHRPFVGTPGCVVVCESPLLVLAGDAFVKMSHFDGCVDSAIAVKNVVNAAVQVAKARECQ